MPARDLAQSDTALIDGFSDHLTLERHLAPSTVDAYRRDLSQLGAFLRRNRRDLPGAGIDDLRRFLALLTSLGYARASIARRVGAIHTFYRWAVDEGRIETVLAQHASKKDAQLVRGRVGMRASAELKPQLTIRENAAEQLAVADVERENHAPPESGTLSISRTPASLTAASRRPSRSAT